jgi:hypothetical protein
LVHEALVKLLVKLNELKVFADSLPSDFSGRVLDEKSASLETP